MSATSIRGVIEPLNRINEMIQEFVKEIRKYNRPRVIVQIKPSNVSVNILNLEIKNIGNVAAYDVSCRFVPDVRYHKTELLLSQLPVFNNLRLLAPREEIAFFFANAIDYFNDPTKPMEIETTVSYRDSENTTYEEQFIIKINQLENLAISREKGFDDIVIALRRIERELDKIEYLLRQRRD